MNSTQKQIITYRQILSVPYYDDYLSLIEDIYQSIKKENSINEEKVWNDAEIMNNDTYYQDYLSRYPNGKYVSIAQSRIGQKMNIKPQKIVSEELVWNDAEILNSLKGYQKYLDDFPSGKYAVEAKKRLSK